MTTDKQPEWEQAEERASEWDRLREAIAESPGSGAYARINAIARSRKIFSRNAIELGKLLNSFNAPAALYILDSRHPERLDEYLDEVARLLHNFVASVALLIDHTRNIMAENYAEDDPLRVEYQRRAKDTFVVPLPQFVRCLRNYLLHYRLPVTPATISFGPDVETGIESSVSLDRDSLLRWDGWNTLARQYLESCEAQINFLPLVESYHETVWEFYTWLLGSLNDKHAGDFERTNELITEEHDLLGVPADER